MSDMSEYLGDKLLNWLTAAAAFGSAPANVYAALYNGDPDGGGTELTGTINLTRQAVSWAAVASREVDNDAEVDFGTADNSGTATYVVLVDTASGAFNQFSKKSIASASITNGEKVAIAIGDLVLSY